MKIVLTLIITLSIGFSHSAKAFWGNPADTAYLAQILAQAIAQLQQLKMILKDGQDSLNLMRDVNAGIFDTLKILKSVAGPMNPGLYSELSKIEDVAHKIQELYGTIANSPLKESQSKTDQAVSEAISFNNDLYRYSKDLDQVGEEIKIYADRASPGRAQKLTVQSLGVIIHVMNQQLRAHATGLKLQAQALAIQNKKSKDETTEYLNQTQLIAESLNQYKFSPKLPRF